MRHVTLWNIAALIAAALYAMSAWDLVAMQHEYFLSGDSFKDASYGRSIRSNEFAELAWSAGKTAMWQAAALFLGVRTHWILAIPGAVLTCFFPAVGLSVMAISIIGLVLVALPHVQILLAVMLVVMATGTVAAYAGLRHEEIF